MPQFVEKFDFSGNPFEKYVAENEPNIQDYAVVPPYFEEIKKRTNALSSYILFGYRGAGKSATRITNEKDVWTRADKGEKVPLVISLTNFEPIIANVKLEDLSANRIISHVAFLVIEGLLLWVSNQDDPENYVELLNDDELREFVKVVKAHYLIVPESARKLSAKRTMQVLQQTWFNNVVYWVEKRWEPISTIVSKVASKAGQRYADLDDTAAELNAMLKKDPSYEVGVAVLEELVSCARCFGFSGICIYIDKVDETSKTSASSEAAARLAHPILSQVQLTEIDGFSWNFFLWDRILLEFDGQSGVRMDKLAFSEISWEEDFLVEMINKRISYFSNGKVLNGQLLCENGTNFSKEIKEFIRIVSRSPRELVRLLDVLVREYDVKHASKTSAPLLSNQDFSDAIDSYVKNIVWATYDRKYLSQILRLGMQRFTNKDVQGKFRISDQSARNWIRNWTQCGIVRQSGTTAGDSEAIGKPANVYSIYDPRVTLMMERSLYDRDALIVEVPVSDNED